jgi:hypothetical protein
MKGSVVLVLGSAILFISLLHLAVFVSSSDAHSVFAFVPESDYDVGAEVPIYITIFEDGEYIDPDFLNLSIEQYDETYRDQYVTRTDVGQYLGRIVLLLTDINDDGAVFFEVRAHFGPDVVWEGDYFKTIYQHALRADILLTDPYDIVVRPGQAIEFDVKVTFMGETVDPDPGTLIAYCSRAVDGPDWYLQIPLDRISEGWYNGTFQVPPGGVESMHFRIDVRLNYTRANRTWSDSIDRSKPVYITYYRIWAHHANVTRKSADLMLFFENLTGVAVRGASVNLSYSYYRDIKPSHMIINLNGTTDANGIATFHISYTDIKGFEEWFDIEGQVDHLGFRQHFQGRVHIPPESDDGSGWNNGLKMRILTKEPLPANEETTISIRVTEDGVPRRGFEVLLYLMTEYSILFNGLLETGDDGFINISITTKTFNINLVYRYCNDYLGDSSIVRGNHWFEISKPSYYTGPWFLDEKTSISVVPFPPGGPVEVTIYNPDADGMAEMAGVIWGVGNISDYRDDDDYPSWRAWTHIGSTLFPYITNNVEIASWDGEVYSAMITLPTFLPDDVRIFVLGLIEFKDSPYQDIRRALLEDLTATLPHARPLVNIMSPVEGGHYHGMVDVEGTATGVISVQWVEIRDESDGWIRAQGTGQWNLSLTSEDLQSGENTIQVRAFDGEIWSKVVQITFTFDRAPSVSIEVPSDGGRYGGLLIVRGQASDDLSLEQVEMRLDDGDWISMEDSALWTHDIDTSLLEYGPHTIYARAFDGFIYSTVVSHSFFVDQRPSVQISSPGEGDLIHGWTIAEGLSADEVGVPMVEVRFDKGPWVAIGYGHLWNHTIDPSVLGSGPHILEARAFDGYSYSGTAEVNFTIDLTPMVIVTVPVEGQMVHETLDFLGTASDDIAIENVDWRIDGGTWDYALGTTGWSVRIDSTMLSHGEHVFEVRCSDYAQQCEPVSVVFFVNQLPEVSLIGHNYGHAYKDKVKFSGTASDDTFVDRIEVQIDDEGWHPLSQTDSWTYLVHSTHLEEGVHTFEIRVYDEDGESTDLNTTFEFTISKEAESSGWIILLVAVVIVVVVIAAVMLYRQRSSH